MATPESAATSGSTRLSNSTFHGSGIGSGSGSGNKRGACDRCRGQKLRCLWDDESHNPLQAPCVRCFKAGATCSFGTPKRAGRPPAFHAPYHQQRRGHGNGGKELGEGGTASRRKPNASSRRHSSHFGARGNGRLLGDNTEDQESERETEDLTSVELHTRSPSSLHSPSGLTGITSHFPAFSGSSTATLPALPWPDDALPSLYTDDAAEAPNLESFGPNYSCVFQTYEAQPMNIHLPTALPITNDKYSREVAVNAYETPAQLYLNNAQISGSSNEAMDVDPPSGSAQTESFRPAKASDKVKESQHRRMQELSELALDLYAQLAAQDPESYQPTSGAKGTAFQDQLVGSVLKSSNTFLTLLNSFSVPATAPSPPLPYASPAPTDQIKSTYSSSDSDASPPASSLGHKDLSVDEQVQQFQDQLPAGSPDNPKLPPPTDMTTVLQLLTCYLRIIHLHSIMHTRILEYMLAFFPQSTQHIDSVPPVFPGMQVGGVSLDDFGKFQVKLLLQISMHMLGEIESALGLPEEYMVGKRKNKRAGRGLLQTSVSGSFVKLLMKEESWRGKKVECVRERLADLKRVLKGAIDLE